MSVDVPEQVQDPIAEQAPSAHRRRRPFVAGFASGLWSLVVGVAIVTSLVMLAWATSPNAAGDSVAAWRAVGLVWLGAHQVALDIGGRPVTLLPLGGVLLGLLLTRRGGAWAGRLLPDPTPGEVGGILAGAGVAYGLGAAGIAWLSGSGPTTAAPGQAFTAAAAVAVAGTAWGISREADLVGQVRERITDGAWRTVVAGATAVAGLVAVGSALTALSLFRNGGQASLTLADLDAGFLGGLALTVLDALCLPTLAIWAMSVVVGPGFSLGSTGSLSAFGGQIEALPALPVLAAIPTTAPAWARFLLLVPIGLGVLAGRIRWGRDLPTLSGALAGAAGVGAVVAAGCAGLALLASGSLGGGRLDQVGPQALPVAAAAAGLVMLGFLAEAAYQSLRLSWELHQAEQRAIARGASVPEEAEEAAEGTRQAEPAGADDADGSGAGEADVQEEEPHGQEAPVTVDLTETRVSDPGASSREASGTRDHA